MAETGDIFRDSPVARWKVADSIVRFAVLSIEEDGGNRLVRRARPYRRGAKIDSTGAKEKVWSVDTIWENSIDEQGLPQSPALYPDALNAMIRSCDEQQTGDLTLPTRGSLRCRLETYRRRESFEERDAARVTFVFVEDNEDNVDAAALEQPSVRSTVRRAVDETNFSLEATGTFTAFMEELEERADELQEAIAAPGEFLQDIDQKAARVIRIVDNVVNQFSVTGDAAHDRLTDPTSHAAVRQAAILQDRVAGAVAEKTAALPRIVTVLYDRTRSIFDIAVELGQDPTQLLNLNARLEDPLRIDGGTLVRVFERDG